MFWQFQFLFLVIATATWCIAVQDHSNEKHHKQMQYFGRRTSGHLSKSLLILRDFKARGRQWHHTPWDPSPKHNIGAHGTHHLYADESQQQSFPSFLCVFFVFHQFNMARLLRAKTKKLDPCLGLVYLWQLEYWRLALALVANVISGKLNHESMTHLFSTILCIAFPTLHQDHWVMSISWTILLPYMCTLSWPFAVNFMKLPKRPLRVPPRVAWISPLSSGGIRISKGQAFTWSSRKPSWNLPRILNLLNPRTLKLVWLTSSYCVFMSSTSHQPKQASYQVVMFLLIFNKVGRKQVGFVYSNHFLSKGWKNGVQNMQN